MRIEDPAERARLKERARGVWMRAALLGTILTVIATGLLLIR